MKGFGGVLQAIDKESPRGMVLILSGFLEESLKRILRAFLREGTSEAEIFEGADSLGTFSARIRMAQALGLISDAEASKLHTIRSIRNDFAHEPGASFEIQSIIDRANNLGDGASPRLRFQFAAITLIISILRRVEHFAKSRRQPMDERLETKWEAVERLPEEAKLLSRGGRD
jgi:hypothetical protein